MKIRSKIAPCLWFDSQAEDAANFYTGIFKDSKIIAVTRYGEAGQEIHGGKPGTVLTVAFVSFILGTPKVRSGKSGRSRGPASVRGPTRGRYFVRLKRTSWSSPLLRPLWRRTS